MKTAAGPRTSRRRSTARVAAMLVGALILAACGGTEDAADLPSAEPSPAPAPAPEPEQPTLPPLGIVVTTSILGDVVSAIVGDDATVRVLIGPGVDPHGYEASASDAAAMRDADLVVANGLMLEERLVSVLDAAEADGARVLTLADKVDPIEFSFAGDDGHSHGHSHSHSHGDDEHGEEDPHFWWDPIRMTTAIELIGAELIDIRPEVDWSARITAYTTDLMAVHEDLVALFATIPEARKRIITNHDALGYVEERYGFEVIGTVLPGTTAAAEQNPQALARLIDLVVAEGVGVIFIDEFDTIEVTDAVIRDAAARGVEVRFVRIFTDALGRPGSGAETYLGMLRTTAQLITDALTAA